MDSLGVRELCLSWGPKDSFCCTKSLLSGQTSVPLTQLTSFCHDVVISRGLPWAQNSGKRGWRVGNTSVQQKVPGIWCKYVCFSFFLVIQIHWANLHAFVNICELKIRQTVPCTVQSLDIDWWDQEQNSLGTKTTDFKTGYRIIGFWLWRALMMGRVLCQLRRDLALSAMWSQVMEELECHNEQ